MNYRRCLVLVLITLLPFVATGCGPLLVAGLSWGHRNDPPAPQSRGNIARARSSHTDLRLSWLKLEDYPALKKFYRLSDVHFNKDAASDAKLEALAHIGFTNLHLIVIHNCPLVTDHGMEFLSQVPSLQSLVVRNTSVTDRGIEIICTRIRLAHVNVAKCTNVTARGLLQLAQTETLTSLGFSCENLTEADLLQILGKSRQLTEVWIYFPKVNVAQTEAISAAARAKGIKLVYEGTTFWTIDEWDAQHPGSRPSK